MARAGDTVGPWKLIERLGRGRQGQVWAARKVGEEASERVALKLIRAGKPKKRDRFIQEIGAHHGLSKDGAPNIIRVLDHNLEELEDGGVEGFIVMPEAAGSIEDFEETLRGRPDMCLEVLEGVLVGLEAAHDRGIVHRDLKPANILFADSSLREPLVADFGICLLRETPGEVRVTEEGETVGARYFMAPEQERGGVADVNEDADLYAASKLLHHMITGRYIYREEVDVAFSEEAQREDVRLDWIQEEILERTVLKNPADRIQTAAELLAVVRDIRRRIAQGVAESIGKASIEGDLGGEEDHEIEQGIDAPATPDADEDDSDVRDFPDLRPAYTSHAARLVEGQAAAVELEFDELRRSFRDTWSTMYPRIESSPDVAEEWARSLVIAQPQIAALTTAMARTDAIALYPVWKRFIEYMLSTTEGRSGYTAIFRIPGVLCGFLYMLASVVSYSNEKWKVFDALLNRPFEWEYRSDSMQFSPGFLLPQLFHPDTLGRYSNKAHDLYRELLALPSIVAITNLSDEDLLNAYLQVQFLMTMKAVQLREMGKGDAIWPDYGRFYANRLNRLLNRIEHDDGYAGKIAELFGESAEQLRSNLPDRMKVPPEQWWSGARYFWDSHTTWDFEDG